MKRHFFLSLLAAALIFNACEISVSLPDYTPDNPGVPMNTSSQFWAQDVSKNTYYQLNAQKLAEGNYCTVWGETGNSRATAAVAQSMARVYDGDVYPKMKAVFSIDNLTYEGYKFSDTMEFADAVGDQDGKLCILLLDIRDGFTPSTSTGYIAGYFSFGDFLSTQDFRNSNLRDMIYIDTYPSTPGSPDSNKTLAHELQHMMNFVNTVAIRDTLSDTWLTEGLSSAAEWVYTGTPDADRLDWYNKATTANGSRITTGNNFFAWDQYNDINTNMDDYATVNLFFQWLRLQSGGSSSIYRAISRSTHSDYNAIVSSIRGYDDWGSLLKTWLAANYINASSGPYGYMGDGVFKDVRARTAPSGTRSVNLYPGEGVYSVTNDSGRTPSQERNIRYAGLNRSTGVVNDSNTFQSGALLTYNIDTNLEGRPEAGTTTGVAANVEPAPEGLFVGTPRGPFAISARDMLRHNGYEETDLPLQGLRTRIRDN